MKIEKVHSDSRGETHSLTSDLLTFPEVAIFYTKKGIARGGCYHSKSSEYLTVLEGEIEYVYGDDMQRLSLRTGDSFTIPPKTPHYFISLSNSLVAEWGPGLDEKRDHHLKFREIVMEHNKHVQS